MTIVKYTTRYGVTFITDKGEYHTFKDFGMYPTAWPDIPPAEVKTMFIDLPGADGGLDMSEVTTGYPVYSNREGTFSYVVPREELWDGTLSQVKRALHGRRARIIKDEEPDVYYYGRVSVEKMDVGKARGIVTIKADLEPYAYDMKTAGEDWLWDPFSFETGVIRGYKSITVDGETAVTIVSSALGGYPTITTSAAGMTVTHDGTTYNLSKGKNALADIELPRGEEEVELVFTGSGTVSIDYRTGRL